jgi:hypothetical protein
MNESETEKPGEAAKPPAGDQAEPLRCAAEAVRCAEAEWRRAKEGYEKLKGEAAARIKAAREASLGQTIDAILAAVRKYPGPSVVVALLAGLFLGRLFKK